MKKMHFGWCFKIIIITFYATKLRELVKNNKNVIRNLNDYLK